MISTSVATDGTAAQVEAAGRRELARVYARAEQADRLRAENASLREASRRLEARCDELLAEVGRLKAEHDRDREEIHGLRDRLNDTIIQAARGSRHRAEPAGSSGRRTSMKRSPKDTAGPITAEEIGLIRHIAGRKPSAAMHLLEYVLERLVDAPSAVADIGDIGGRLATLERDVFRLGDRVGAMREAPAATEVGPAPKPDVPEQQAADAGDLEALASRVGRLEKQVVARFRDVHDLTERVRHAENWQRNRDRERADPDALAARIEALERWASEEIGRWPSGERAAIDAPSIDPEPAGVEPVPAAEPLAREVWARVVRLRLHAIHSKMTIQPERYWDDVLLACDLAMTLRATVGPDVPPEKDPGSPDDRPSLGEFMRAMGHDQVAELVESVPRLIEAVEAHRPSVAVPEPDGSKDRHDPVGMARGEDRGGATDADGHRVGPVS